jgi:excisionase family DNA binding protein
VTTQQPRLLYDVTEACAQLSIGRSKLFELIASGEIRAVKIGSRRFVPHDSLRAYVDRLLTQVA